MNHLAGSNIIACCPRNVITLIDSDFNQHQFITFIKTFKAEGEGSSFSKYPPYIRIGPFKSEMK